MTFKVSHDFLDGFHRLGAKPGHEFGMPPAKKLSYLLRPAFVADAGKTLVWGDWSNIEARVLPWLAASPLADAKLDIFRAVDEDPSLPDIYIRTAGDLLGEDANELWAALAEGDPHAKSVRQSHGKVPELSLGFGGGLGALMAMATGYGVYLEEAKALEMIQRWRSANSWAQMFWGAHGREGSYGIWGAVNSAIENPDTIYTAGRVAYVYDPSYLRGTLFCALPCGRLLTYPAIKWEWREVEDKKTGKLVDRYQLTYLKGYGRTAAWYGKFCVSGDALVATDSGWKRLDNISVADRVWDGVAWARHEGLVQQGVKATVSVDGVRMTPDHEVLTSGGWLEAQKCHGAARWASDAPESLSYDRSPLLVDPSVAQRPVYDLVNAGPRRRFMVLGERGPFIVHNCENITQATAASVLRRTMKRVENWWGDEKTGPLATWMPLVMHTHDEIVSEVDEGRELDAGRALKWIMETNDEWDEGLPLACEISASWYYTKNEKISEMKL